MNEHYIKGLAFCKEEKYEDAIKAFTASLLLSPMQMEALYNRGLAKFYSDKYLDAIQDFDRALELAPSNANIYSQRGVAKHLLKQNEAALKDMDRAVALDPENGYRYSSRAYIRHKMGDVFGAIDDYKKAIEIDPEDAISINNLGLVEQVAGFKKQAEERFKQADGIADRGKTFERPNLDELLREVNESSAQKIVVSQPESQEPKPQFTPIAPQRQALSWNAYWKTVKSILTSKETFGDFMKFVKRLGRNGQ